MSVHAWADSKASAPIRIQLVSEPSTLDPSRVIDLVGISVLRNVVEGLFKLDPSGNLQNGLAASYTISKNHLTYRFKLKKDAVWSDGRPVQIEDFIFSLRHAIDPKTACPDADKLFAIENARDVYIGKKPLSALAVSRDKNELVITLVDPDPTLPMELSLPPFSPLRQDVFEAHHGRWSPDYPVTGDYRIAEYKPSSEVHLEPNPRHRVANQRPIVFHILPEEMTAMNLFESGGLDIISSIVPNELNRFIKAGAVQMAPSTLVFYVAFNVSKPPFQDLAWRQAVAASVDREGMAKVLHGTYEPTTSWIPKALDGSLPYQPLRFDKAVASVRSAKDKPSITLAFPASTANELIAEKLQYDLEKGLGVRIKLQPIELKMLLAKLATDPPEMYMMMKSALYNDPLNHLNAFTNAPEPSFTHYKGAKYEDLVAKVKRTPLGPQRIQFTQAANRLITEQDVVVVPLLLKKQVFAVAKSIHGFKANPYQVIQLNSLEK